MFSYHSPFTTSFLPAFPFLPSLCVFIAYFTCSMFYFLQDGIIPTFLFLDNSILKSSMFCSVLDWVSSWFFLFFFFLIWVESTSFWISWSHSLFYYSIFSSNYLWKGVLEVNFLVLVFLKKMPLSYLTIWAWIKIVGTK